MTLLDSFKATIVVMMFYSFAITLMAHSFASIPGGDGLNYVTAFTDSGVVIDMETTNAEIRDSLNQQTNIPVIEFGSLVFYSGNILADMILNFVFAIPEMIGLLVNGIQMLLNIDGIMFAYVEIFSCAVMFALYVVGIIELLTNIRSGRAV